MPADFIPLNLFTNKLCKWKELWMKERYNPHEIEEKWHLMWARAKIFEPEPDDREKFFITIPYPYLNGNLHAGHTRTFTIGDVIARYKRMRGKNVLFPMGFHATGTPIVGLAEQIQYRQKAK